MPKNYSYEIKVNSTIQIFSEVRLHYCRPNIDENCIDLADKKNHDKFIK